MYVLNGLVISIGSGHGLAPSRRQAMTWTNDGTAQWRTHGSPSFMLGWHFHVELWNQAFAQSVQKYAEGFFSTTCGLYRVQNYTHGWRFVEFCRDLVPIAFNHILQGYFNCID